MQKGAERKRAGVAIENRAHKNKCWSLVCRQSWRQCLQGKVIPVMAAVIAYLDTNNNLDLLYHDGGDTSDLWVQHLWLKIFVHQDIGHLNYKRMQSMNGKEELEEFVVHYECPCAALFSAKLPFSWILLQFVENALTEVSESLGGQTDVSCFIFAVCS